MDRIIRAIAGDGFVNMSVITARDMVQRAREIHNCTPTTAAALGRTLCATSLLGNMLKSDKASVTVRIQGGGPAGIILGVSDAEGNVRGYIDDPTVDLPLKADGHLDVGTAVGREGMLTVIRDVGMREPYVGSTELITGEIAEDFTAYLLESEQVPSACGLGVLVDTDTSIKAAGGFVVQLLPGADEKLIEVLEENIFMMDQLTTILDEDGAEVVFDQVLKGLDYQILEQTPVEYRCTCSKERLSEALACIDRKELESLIEANEDVEICCDFCGTHHIFTTQELVAISAKSGEETEE